MRSAEGDPRSSTSAGGDFRLVFDPVLVEEAVLLAIECRPPPLQQRFRRERDPLYELAGAVERDRAFERLHAEWFDALGLGAPLVSTLEEEPTIARRARRCTVLAARSKKEEYADVQGAAGDAPNLVLRLRPASFVAPARLVPLLRHELQHVADLLDPDFGFVGVLDSEAPEVEDNPALQNVVRERYRVLWDTTVDGRLSTRGQLSEAAEGARRREFLAAFSCLGEGGEDSFERFFRGSRPSHRELLRYAADPKRTGGVGERCPLCRLPGALIDPSGTSASVVEAIQGEFPEWSSENGLCRQCGDLYEARLRLRERPRFDSH